MPCDQTPITLTLRADSMEWIIRQAWEALEEERVWGDLQVIITVIAVGVRVAEEEIGKAIRILLTEEI